MELARGEESERVRALLTYDILDTAPEVSFDDVTATCAELLDVPIALISFLDTDRQWFKSRVGTDVREIRRSVAFCDHAIRSSAPMLIEDASKDARFAQNPLVLQAPGVRFYAGVPLRSADGYILGTLCVLDTEPRRFGARQVAVLERLARQVELGLELRRQAVMLQRQLGRCEAERAGQEMLVTMLVHDLRNPLTAIALSVVAGREDPSAADECLQEVEVAVERTRGMLADILDLCLARTGHVSPRRVTLAVRPLLENVVAAVSRAAADRGVALRLGVSPPEVTLDADPDMVTRALINLAENALRHSPRGEAVTLSAAGDDTGVTLSVEDRGRGIPVAEHARVFEPFVSLGAPPQHHGLGLAFCKLAADAHGGRIWIEEASPHGARLLLQIPRRAEPLGP